MSRFEADLICGILIWLFMIIVFFVVGLYFWFNENYLSALCIWLFVGLFLSMPFLTEEAGF